jgi:hypothetical protein
MNTSITKRQDMALTGLEAFEAFADTAVGIDAEIVKFTRGVWTIGKDNEPVDASDQFLAVVTGIKHGFVKWELGKPTGRRMLLVADHPQAPARSALGDLDMEEWSNDKDGQPADPWQFTIELPMLDLETEARRLYATSSNGGQQCIGKLVRTYAHHMRKHPGELPVVTFGAETYKHQSYGVIAKPLLRIVHWLPDPDWTASETSASPATYAEELDDEIPF